MHLEYYIIRGRGQDGLSFQLARIKDQDNNTYKNEYDMTKQFTSIDELKTHLAKVVKTNEADLTISPMVL
jgi:hypothetical protein